jgi:hypothetical protein
LLPRVTIPLFGNVMQERYARAVNGTAISDDQKREFLELVRSGDLRPIAAQKVGSTGSRFRALCNPDSFHYDEKFAEDYRQIMESGEHQENRLEALRAASDQRAITESDRLLEKLLLIHDPQWEFMRSQKVEVNASLESFVHEHLGSLSSSQIRQLMQWVQEGKGEIDAPRLLEAAKDDVEAA